MNLVTIIDATSFFNNHTNALEEPNCVIIPKEYSDEPILVGNIDTALGYIKNVYEAEIKFLNNPENPCILELDWKLMQKKDFIFFYANDTKISLTNENPNCRFKEEILSDGNVEEEFVSWNNYMASKTGFVGLWSFTNLFYLKQEESLVDPKSVNQPFISNFIINQNATNEGYLLLKNIKANMSIWNGPIRYGNSE